MGKIKDLSGLKFDRLKVLYQSGFTKARKAKWLCECDCGKIVLVIGSQLVGRHTKSCGCYNHEMQIKNNTIHRGSRTRLYNTWGKMLTRCNSPKEKGYKDYGGRGIKVCEEWCDFITFRNWALASGYTDELTIERKNVNGNYEPSNCEWITNSEQANNKRNSHLITHNGKTQNIKQWANELGVSYDMLFTRINRNWKTEDVFSSLLHLNKHYETYKGKTQTLKQWAEEYNISRKLLNQRLNKQKWPIEKALMTPIKKCNRKHPA